MIHSTIDASGKRVTITAQGKLSAADYEKVTPELERLLDEHGKLELLFDMSGVENIDLGAVWQDFKFDARHLTDFKRVAIVGNAGWQKALTKLGNPFTSAEVEYFSAAEKEAAADWLARS